MACVKLRHLMVRTSCFVARKRRRRSCPQHLTCFFASLDGLQYGRYKHEALILTLTAYWRYLEAKTAAAKEVALDEIAPLVTMPSSQRVEEL